MPPWRDRSRSRSIARPTDLAWTGEDIPPPVLHAGTTAEPPADFMWIALTVTEARRLFQLFNSLRDLPTALAARRMTFHL